MAKIVSVFLMLILVNPVLSMQRFQASFEESQWLLQSSPVRCQLSHPIPRYGQGNFVHSSNGELAFTLDVLQPPMEDGVASMVSEPSFWKASLKAMDIGEFSVSAGRTPIYAPHKIALRILYELDAGKYAVMHYKDWADHRDDVRVALSPVRFREVLPDFQKCISQLLPYSFDDLKQSTVTFQLNKSVLTDDARQILENPALYAREFENIKILIEGHTDAIGSRYYNNNLSRKRAQSVREFLVSRGIPASRIVLKGYGERKPVASNYTETGRAANRRVRVTLNMTK